jgi:Cu(I)/Ag(I) efflux system membrane fusion protein
MRFLARLLLTLTLVVFGATAGVLSATTFRSQLDVLTTKLFGETLGAEASGPKVLYYRNPMDLPDTSPVPKKDSMGMDYLPVFETDAGTAASGGARKVLYYRNPMGLPDTSPVPKKDSMGMDYIPVYEDEGNDDGAVTVSPGKLQQTGVRTVKAVLAPLPRSLRAPGIVTLDERQTSVIALRADAFIESVADVTTGSLITQGATLGTFYSPDVVQAIAQFVTDLRTEGSKQPGSRQRLENLGIPAEVIDRIAKERKTAVSIPIMAPRTGVVLERMAVEGMKAEAGDTLFRIADLSSVWVIAEVPEATLMEVTPGASVRVSFPGRTGFVAGQIDKIYPEVDMTTRTAKLRIELPNPDGRLRANMYAEVEIMLEQSPVVQVPEGAVIDTGDRQVVLLDVGDGRFRPKPVTIGRRGGGMAEIVAGVAEGDRVVSAATFLIDAESNLNAALDALATAEAEP